MPKATARMNCGARSPACTPSWPTSRMPCERGESPTAGGPGRTQHTGRVAERFRVASFNIRTARGRDGRNSWWLRREICLAAIRGLAADIVGLQEVRPAQLAALRRAFPDATIVGAGRDAGGGGEHASVLVRN